MIRDNIPSRDLNNIYSHVHFLSDRAAPHMNWPCDMGGTDPEAGAEGCEVNIGGGEAPTPMVLVPFLYTPGAAAGGTDIGPEVLASMML